MRLSSVTGRGPMGDFGQEVFCSKEYRMASPIRQIRHIVASAAVVLVVGPTFLAARGVDLDHMVQADWAAQERRLGRSPADPQAIAQTYEKAKALLGNLQTLSPQPDLADDRLALESLGATMAKLDQFDEAERLALYHQVRSIGRGMALKNPLVANKRIAFMKRRRFICQMLHEYLGYYYDYGDIAGGGVYVLEQPGRSLNVRDLIHGRLPQGNYATLALSYDARMLYFGFAKRAPEKYDYHSPTRRCFHIWAVNANGSDLRQLTSGTEDDFDPCPLPDGGIAFMSSRRGGFGRCHNLWEPLPTYTLHRMDADGGNVTTLSYHETNEWHPAVLADGRIAYSRWDYVDRSAAHYHGLWVSNPDGTGADVLFGSYTGYSQGPNACFQPRAIPDSRKVLFVAGAHHAVVGGSLVLLDPARIRLDSASGEDCLESLEVLTPEVCFPEVPHGRPRWPSSYFHSPWPLSEDYYLVAFSHKPLPGMGPNVSDDNYTGLYYFDRFGNLELLYADADFSCMYPIPLEPRPAPPVVASSLDPELGDKGEFVLADVRQSLFPLPASRPIRQLRIFQILPKTGNHVANQPRIGYANAESARMMLGTVPVEADGSAYFRAPARKPLYFQAVDETGHAVQSMRSVTYLQPGERQSCIGCHEPPDAAVAARSNLMALRRPPSHIEPGPPGTQPMGYPLLVQPVLDRHCIGCHDGGQGQLKAAPILTSEPAGTFSKSYESLKPYVRWYEWGDRSIREIGTRPGQIGADESPLLRILRDATHAEHVSLPQDDYLRLCIWLDGNAPFYGTYEKEANLAQQAGQAVPAPALQ